MTLTIVAYVGGLSKAGATPEALPNLVLDKALAYLTVQPF